MLFENLPPQRILLIEPPFYTLFGYKRYHYPVTLVLVGTYLQEMGHYVSIYDTDKPAPHCREYNRTETRTNYHRYEEAIENKNNPMWNEIRNTINEFRPDIVGITSITAKIESADIVAGIAKELYGDNVKVVLGGPHVNGMLDMFTDYNFGSNYDDVVTYIPGLVNRKPNKRLIMNYNEYSGRDFSSIMTSSGCPNSCTFCCHSFEKGLVYRDKESIQYEINEIKEEFGTTDPVYVMDDCFLSNNRHYNETVSIINKAGLKFTAGARIMALSEEKLEIFQKCGGQRMYLGVESGSQRVLDLVKKKLKVEAIIKRTKWLNDRGIPWSAFFVAGFPFETIDDLKMTEELIYKIRPTFVSLNQLTPYPGTAIYKEYFIGKKLRFRDLFQLADNTSVNLSDEVRDYIDHMFNAVDIYNRGNIK